MRVQQRAPGMRTLLSVDEERFYESQSDGKG